MINVPVCRRCSECPNSYHHWIECCEEIETGEAGEVIFDRVCKHCGCLGTACEKCDGDGCEECRQEGVIESCMYIGDEE